MTTEKELNVEASIKEAINEMAQDSFESFEFIHEDCVPQDDSIKSKVSNKLSNQLLSILNADFANRVKWMLEDYINLPISSEKLFTRASILLNQIKNNPSSDYSNLFTVDSTESVLQIWLESSYDGLNASEIKLLMRACVEINDLKV